MINLKKHYYSIILLLVAFYSGVAIYWPEISAILEKNPHVLLNYVIFAIIIFGSFQAISHSVRLRKEYHLFSDYIRTIDSENILTNNTLPENFLNKSDDVVGIIKVIEELRHSPLTNVQHEFVASELKRFVQTQVRYLLITQHLSGLMVGLGLFGTFVGLLGALDEIANLIGSFDLINDVADPMSKISELVVNLMLPMKSMGVAFSASLFGVVGSLLMGLLMVIIKSSVSEFVSQVESGTTMKLNVEGGSLKYISDDNTNPTFLLQGLANAVESSERRVRDLLSVFSQLATRIEINTNNIDALIKLSSKEDASDQKLIQSLETLQLATKKIIEQNELHLASAKVVTDIFASQQKTVINLITEQQDSNKKYLDAQQLLWEKQAATILEISDDRCKNFSNMQALFFDNSLENFKLALKSWVDQSQSASYSLSDHHKQFQVLLLEDKADRQKLIETIGQKVEIGLHTLMDNSGETHKLIANHSFFVDKINQNNSLSSKELDQACNRIAQVLNDFNLSATSDLKQRVELNMNLERLLTEIGFRNEQIVKAIGAALTK